VSAGLVLAVLGAGAVGALLRYGTSILFASRSSFPWAVLVVNASGAALGGVLLGLASRAAISDDWHLILLSGVAAGLTTFSTWSVDTMQLVLDGRWRTAAVNVGANLFAGLAVATVAWLITR
jgi:CrcB protein